MGVLQMKRLFFPCLLVTAGLFLGCSTTYQAYQADIWGGRQLLDDGHYKQAREDFVKAANAMPAEPYPYALAATASYKMNDVSEASRLIQEAAKRDKQGDAYIRIMGYKALILLKEGKEKEGRDALNDYILAYQKEYAPQNVREVRAMWRGNGIDVSALQQLLDDEIWTYESDIDQFRRSGTGWFAAKNGVQPISNR